MERHRRFRYSDDRFFNDLQELRNSLIVLNVLLRKAIQRAEVHPCYIDTLSAGYYQRIRTVTVEQVPALREEMLVGYCRLRKAIQRAEVHPCYIDTLSAGYYQRIRTVTVEQVPALREEMLVGYCRCVQEYAMSNYSPLMRSVIYCIILNMAESLSLRALAEQFFISQSYLSNLFRSEVGVTLVEYINSSRMKRAAGPLIRSVIKCINLNLAESLSLRALAEQFFISQSNLSNLFRREVGVSLGEYINSSRL